MNETERHTAKRRIMTRSYAAFSPEERMDKAYRLVEEAWNNMSVEGKRRFMSRNLKIRRMRKTAHGWQPV